MLRSVALENTGSNQEKRSVDCVNLGPVFIDEQLVAADSFAQPPDKGLSLGVTGRRS
ncbi:hypothetical protein D3C76_1801880 [compost metagenome]